MACSASCFASKTCMCCFVDAYLVCKVHVPGQKGKINVTINFNAQLSRLSLTVKTHLYQWVRKGIRRKTLPSYSCYPSYSAYPHPGVAVFHPWEGTLSLGWPSGGPIEIKAQPLDRPTSELTKSPGENSFTKRLWTVWLHLRKHCKWLLQHALIHLPTAIPISEILRFTF